MRIKRAIFYLVVFLLGVLAFSAVWVSESEGFEQLAGTKSRVEDILKEKFGVDAARTKTIGEKTLSEAIRETLSDPRVIVDMDIFKMLNKKGLSYFSKEAGLFNSQSIADGLVFLRENKGFVSMIEARYGVEKEVLAGIFRIESNFGRESGSISVLKALVTFAALKNHRFKSADNNLASLFLVCLWHNLDIFKLRGSWMGAFGYCQFMPSSYVYAVDGNGDKKVDLFCFEDAIARAANYLKRHGWKNGDMEKKKKAIFAYNRSDEYVKAVLAYAEAVKP